MQFAIQAQEPVPTKTSAKGSCLPELSFNREGNVALNLDSINDFGLIEIYDHQASSKAVALGIRPNPFRFPTRSALSTAVHSFSV